jgi:MEDS: MEthanogen/methylotroph, DcmR Sensory domain
MTHLGSLHQGDHACALYEDPAHQLAIIAGYIRAGIEARERCLYIVDDRSADDVLDALASADVDVAAARDARCLVVMTKRDSYLKDGTFNPDQMIYSLSAMTDQALADSCSGLRITGEMTWALGSETGCDRLIEYEMKLNRFFPGSRAHALCQYTTTRFPPTIIREVLRHHPIAVVGQHATENPYFEPPDILGLSDAHPRRIEYMLEYLVVGREGSRFSSDLT